MTTATIKRYHYRIELMNHDVFRNADGTPWESRSVRTASRKAEEIGGVVRRITHSAQAQEKG